MKVAVGLIAFLITGGAAAFWFAGAMPMADEPDPPKAAADARAPRFVRAIGYVEPATEIRNLTFKVDGIIETVPVTLGQVIEAGQPIATLQNRDEQAAVDMAEKDLAVARAEQAKLLSGIHPREIEATERRIAKLKERVRHAQQQYDRQDDLFQRKAGTQEAFDLAKTDLEQSKEDLLESQAILSHMQTHVRDEDRALAEAQVQFAESKLAAAKEQYRNTIMLAPIGGTVLEILKREGEAVRAFDPEPVVIFADVSKLRVRAEIDERYTGLIGVGQEATIYGHSLGGKRFKARVVERKSLMGDKTVFSREASERKDLDVLQVFVEPIDALNVPVGLQVDIEVVPGPLTY